MSITYKDSTKQVILSQALALYKDGIATIINDGQDITFHVEEVS